MAKIGCIIIHGTKMTAHKDNINKYLSFGLSPPLGNRRQLERTIDAIEKLDLEQVDISTLRTLVYGLMRGYRWTHEFEPAGLEVFRARPMASRPLSINELSYPPAEITPFGRLNWEGCPVFYAAFQTIGATQEIDPKENSLYCIGRWATNAVCTIGLLGYADSYRSARGSQRTHPHLRAFQGETGSNRFLRDWIAQKFNAQTVKEEHYRYKLTCMLAETVLKLSTPSPDAIQYPSVAWGLGGDSLAFRPTFVDKHMSLLEARMVMLARIMNDEYITGEIDSSTAVLKDGTIIWSGKSNPRFIAQRMPPYFRSTLYGGTEVFAESPDKRLIITPRFEGYKLPEPRYDRRIL